VAPTAATAMTPRLISRRVKAIVSLLVGGHVDVRRARAVSAL
jgi:hypothetical protein